MSYVVDYLGKSRKRDAESSSYTIKTIKQLNNSDIENANDYIFLFGKEKNGSVKGKCQAVITPKVGKFNFPLSIPNMKDDDPSTYAVNKEYVDKLRTEITNAADHLFHDWSKSANIAVSQTVGGSANYSMTHSLVNTPENSKIPALLSNSPYMDANNETALLLCQEQCSYDDVSKTINFEPGNPQPRMLMGALTMCEGLGIVNSMVEYKSNDIQSIFTVLGSESATKMMANENVYNSNPVVNVAADFVMEPYTPISNRSLPTHFDVESIATFALGSTSSFSVVKSDTTNRKLNKYGFGAIRHYNDDDVLFTVKERIGENGLWDFICNVITYIRDGIDIAIKIGSASVPVLKTIREMLDSGERAILDVRSGIRLQPAEGQALPIASLTTDTIVEQVKTPVAGDSLTRWSISKYDNVTYNNGTNDYTGVTELMSIKCDPSNAFEPWKLYTNLQAYYNKGLKVVKIVNDAVVDIWSVLEEPIASEPIIYNRLRENEININDMPISHVCSNLVVEDKITIGGEEIPTTTIFKGKALYTYSEMEKGRIFNEDDFEIATHKYVREHGGSTDNCLLLESSTSQTVKGNRNITYECPVILQDENSPTSRMRITSRTEDGVATLSTNGAGFTFNLNGNKDPNSKYGNDTFGAHISYMEMPYSYETHYLLRISSMNNTISAGNWIDISTGYISFSTPPAVEYAMDGFADNQLVTKSYVDNHRGKDGSGTYLLIGSGSETQKMTGSGLNVGTSTFIVSGGSAVFTPRPTYVSGGDPVNDTDLMTFGDCNKYCVTTLDTTQQTIKGPKIFEERIGYRSTIDITTKRLIDHGAGIRITEDNTGDNYPYYYSEIGAYGSSLAMQTLDHNPIGASNFVNRLDDGGVFTTQIENDTQNPAFGTVGKNWIKLTGSEIKMSAPPLIDKEGVVFTSPKQLVTKQYVDDNTLTNIEMTALRRFIPIISEKKSNLKVGMFNSKLTNKVHVINLTDTVSLVIKQEWVKDKEGNMVLEDHISLRGGDGKDMHLRTSHTYKPTEPNVGREKRKGDN